MWNFIGKILVSLIFLIMSLAMTIPICFIGYNFIDRIVSAALLADDGISISAKVIEYHRGGSYTISYDGYKENISVPVSSLYSLKSSLPVVPVVYDKYHPRVVLLGRSHMTMWELIMLNSDFLEIIILVPLVFGFTKVSILVFPAIKEIWTLKETSVENEIRRNCYNCQAGLSQINKNGPNIIYKYCPKCGKENNSTIKTKHDYKSHGLRIFFMWCFMMVIVFVLDFDYHKTIFAEPGFTFMLMGIFTTAGLFVFLLVAFFNKTCSHCGCNLCYRWWHNYCFNCGRPL